MKYDVVKILAIGSYKRFMFINLGLRVYCVRISDHMYQQLKNQGVPTSQYL